MAVVISPQLKSDGRQCYLPLRRNGRWRENHIAGGDFPINGNSSTCRFIATTSHHECCRRVKVSMMRRCP